MITHPLPKNLPVPDADMQAVESALAQQLEQEIREQGAIPFDRLMECLLYQPGLGYYVNGLRKFGEQGDFVTSPEMGEVFADCWPVASTRAG